MQKSNIKDLLRDYSTILIWVVKLVDEKVIRLKTLECWYRL